MPLRIRSLVLAGLGGLSVALTTSLAVAQNSDAQKPKVVTSAPTLNFYGLPGVIDTPSAEALPDGQFALGISHFGGQTRTTVSFQFSPRITASFRYIGIQNWNSDGFETYRDRSFDFRYLLLKERQYRPAVSVGLQDFAGTGIYAGEYLVATKNFIRPFRLPGRAKVTAGLGWGRLASSGSIGSPLGENRPVFNPGDTGGELAVDQWFRGPVSPFGGIEWQYNDRLGFKLEYSPDAYVAETSRGVFERDSRVNFGVEYQWTNAIRLGAYYLYGSEIGVNAQIQFNPKRPATPFTVAGPRPIIVRPSRAENPASYDTAWAASQSAPMILRDVVEPELTEDGIRLESLQVTANRAEARVSSTRYSNLAIVIGRTARALARQLPPSVEFFDIVLMNEGLAMSNVTIARRDIETLEFQPNAANALLAASDLSDAAPRPATGAIDGSLAYPRFSYALGPYFRPSYFDPDRPLRLEVGLSAQAQYRFAPGWLLSGEVRHRLAGNLDSGRLSNSVLPRVRTDAVLYAQAGDTTIENLFVSRQWKTGKNTYARVTAGYLEQFFGGVSAEFLWKPATSRLGLGIEANYARQRDFDQQFGFQDYDVATGHISAYYDLGKGYYGQLDVGRYLAGDVGATFTLERQFANGWRVGGFFTLTDVSSEEFGEGSFDKGINITIPTSWFIGEPSRQTVSTTIRPIQRDGGARLSVSGRLYEQIRSGHITDLNADWGRVWE
ncbi:YjbH domain-containing protein [Tateyamaria omphalii]|nr:YjbH domain-containing protein [Tateyamaria omphalii]